MFPFHSSLLNKILLNQTRVAGYYSLHQNTVNPIFARLVSVLTTVFVNIHDSIPGWDELPTQLFLWIESKERMSVWESEGTDM